MSCILSYNNRAFKLYVTNYSFDLLLGVKKEKLRKGTSAAPIQASQSGLRLGIECPSESYASKFQSFVRSAQKGAVDDNRVMSLRWPERNFNFRGVIREMTAGARKFDYAPTYTLILQLTKDLIHTQTGSFSQADDYEDLYQDRVSTTPDGYFSEDTNDLKIPEVPPGLEWQMDQLNKLYGGR